MCQEIFIKFLEVVLHAEDVDWNLLIVQDELMTAKVVLHAEDVDWNILGDMVTILFLVVLHAEDVDWNIFFDKQTW